MNLHEKILDYCFENDNEFRSLKLNNKIIDCSDLPTENLQEQLEQLFENLISRVESGRDICYDAYANCLIDIYHTTEIAPKPTQIFKYVNSVLEVESMVPLNLISTSLIHCLILLMDYEEVEAEYWYFLYENGPSQLKHIFACGFMRSVGFDDDFYFEVSSEVNYRNLFPMLYETKIVPQLVSIEDLRLINASLPDDIQTKIKRETQSVPTFKSVVYN